MAGVLLPILSPPGARSAFGKAQGRAAPQGRPADDPEFPEGRATVCGPARTAHAWVAVKGDVRARKTWTLQYTAREAFLPPDEAPRSPALSSTGRSVFGLRDLGALRAAVRTPTGHGFGISCSLGGIAAREQSERDCQLGQPIQHKLGNAVRCRRIHISKYGNDVAATRAYSEVTAHSRRTPVVSEASLAVDLLVAKT